MARQSLTPVRRAARGAVVATTGLAVALVPATVVVTSAAATTPPAPTTAAGCRTGALPTEVEGRSAAFAKGLPTGAWVWHDAQGFHLRVTHAAKTKLTFSGSIASSGSLSAHRMRTEKHDVIWRNNTKNAARFTLRNHGGVDGIDFRVGCAKKIRLTLRAAGEKLTTAQIFLGADAVNPAGNPVVIKRVPAAPPACASGALPTEVVGRPTAFRAGLPAGAWLWHDGAGYHLRVTHDAKTRQVFAGSITSSGAIKAHRIRSEKHDVLWKNNKHKTVRFALRNYGNVDGIDFKVGCAKSVTLNLRTKVVGSPAVKLTTTQIHLGATGANPAANPFTVTRS